MTLPPGWRCIGPATFARDDGWLVSVDDTDGATLVSGPNHESPAPMPGSCAIAIAAVDDVAPLREDADP